MNKPKWQLLHEELIQRLFPHQAHNIGWGLSSMGIASKVEGFGVVITELDDSGEVVTYVRLPEQFKNTIMLIKQ